MINSLDIKYIMFDTSDVYSNVFTLDEINALRADMHQRPVAAEKPGIAVKNLDYHLEDSVARQIIKPKIDQVIGPDHDFCNGSYKQSTAPYTTHVDNIVFRTDSRLYMFNTEKNHDCVLLIPLVEDPEFRTILYHVYNHTDNLGMGDPLPEKYLNSSNDLNPNWFTHFREPTASQLNRLPVDRVYQWKLGDILMWPCSQLHSSTDFAKYGLVKKFVVIFLS